MLALPSEIIACILESALAHTAFSRRDKPLNKSTVLALARTCRRLYGIAITLIYRALCLEFPRRILQPVCLTGNLLRTLETNPSLALFCRQLDIHVSDVCPARCEADFECLETSLPYFKNVKILCLEANFDGNSRGKNWKFLRRCIKHMPRLESLVLKGRNWAGPSIPEVLQQTKVSTLKELTINGSSTSNLVPEVSKDVEPSNITKLCLHLAQAQSTTLAAFLRWPDTLTHFSIEYFAAERMQGNPQLSDFDLSILQSILLRHKESLTNLRLPSLTTKPEGKLVEFSEFPVLKELAFPRTLLNDHLDETPEILSRLLAPRIKSFILVIRMDSLKEWSDKESRGCLWVMNLAREAVKKRSTLEEINIQVMTGSEGSPVELAYLLDVIQDLNNRCRPHGIAISYTKPVR